MILRPRLPALTLGIAVILVAVSAWIVIPAPLLLLLPLGIAAPELSAWLLVLAALVAAATLPDWRSDRKSRVALVLAVVTIVISTLPLIRAVVAIPHLEAAMQQALGDDITVRVPASVRAGMRTSPIVIGDLFRGLPSSNPRTTSSTVFGAPDGTPLRMDVYSPPSAGPHPALVQIYGGGWQRGDPRNNAEFAGYFAARGYVVFAIDYRHAPRWRWEAQLEDVRRALAWIRSHGAEQGADVERMALLGRSAGAHLALLAAYAPGAPAIRAVVSFYGPADLTRGFREPPRPDPYDVRSVLGAFVGGTPEEQPAAYRSASPITYATRPLPPTLLIYGGRDHVVSPSFGAALHDKLRATGTTAVFLELPWAEHAFDAVPFGPGGQLALYHTERFLAWALQRP
ncbi:MAG: hypothetical protein V7647_158 [Acidobacteriota bacterium]|jgi:acetyl esterase/lipase